MKKRTKKKMLSALLTMAIMTVSLGGCGSTPVDADNVVESTEETMENSTESTVETSNGTTTETGGKNDAGAEGEKPSATPKPTTKPATESTEKPETPQTTAIPEPTQPPHTHDFKVESTVDSTCATEGKIVKVCSCGEKQTEVVPATGNHNWTEITTLVHHDSIGHTESIEEQVQVGTTETRHEYECAFCGERFDTPEATDEHQKASGDFDHAMSRTYVYDYPGEPIYETQTKTVWVVDQEAYDTVEVVGYKCSICGATK